jgi:uncharacterized protein YbaR (Trm112 family)
MTKEIICHFCGKTYPLTLQLPEGWSQLSPALGGWLACPECNKLLDTVLPAVENKGPPNEPPQPLNCIAYQLKRSRKPALDEPNDDSST